MVNITTVLRCYHFQRDADTLLIRCYADCCRPVTAFTTIMKIFPRCFYDFGVSTTFSLRLYPDSCCPRSRYACFKHVQNKRGESAELPDHEHPTAITQRLSRLRYVSPAICHDRTRFLPSFDRSRIGVYV